MILDFLAWFYPWTKTLHILAVISWMAGLFYMPRLLVYHAEKGLEAEHSDQMLQVMEQKLLRAIMNPAMVATWIFGIMLALTPGIVDWGAIWPYTKAGGILLLTWFHHWLGLRRKEFAAGQNSRTGRTYRIMNEVPTLALVVIVISIVVRPF